jgi:hypothetical protein
MTKIDHEAKTTLANMLVKHFQCERAYPSTKKVNLVEEVDSLNVEIDLNYYAC